MEVFGFLWFIWLGAGTLAWTFQIWRDETMGRWALTVLGWFVILVIMIEGDKKKMKEKKAVIEVKA